MSILDFFTREAGQERRRALEGLLTQFIPPEMRPQLGLLAEANPVVSMERAGQDAQQLFAPDQSLMDRLAAGGRMASNMAGVVAPAVVAGRVGMPVANAVTETLTGLSMTPQAAALRDFGADEFGGVGFRAFHGSPHDFDRFSMSKIGTGEGAQAYGHGLYFADSEDVARSYRDRLTMPRDQYGQVIGNPRQYYRTKVDGVDAREGGQDFWEVAEQIAHKGMTYDEYLADLIDKSTWSDSPLVQERFRKEIERAQRFAPDLRGKSITYEPPVGNMYEVQINADPNDFLDSDTILKKQPDSIRAALDPALEAIRSARMNEYDRKEILSGKATGAQLYGALSNVMPGGSSFDRAASATSALREAGIPGIRYLDAGSRGAGDGSRNYVVFDENLIEIVRKYGIAGAAALLGLSQADVAQAMQQQQQPQGLLTGPQ